MFGSLHPWFIVGVIWMILTVGFEFGFGHFVARHSWSRLWQDYDLLAGRVWILFLLWLGIAPWIFSFGLRS